MTTYVKISLLIFFPAWFTGAQLWILRLDAGI